MPFCVFYTNVASSNVPENFEVQFSEILAEVLSKPLERITVNLLPDQRLVRGGTSEPTCSIIIWAIGIFNEEQNPKFATKLYPFITESLGISNERIFLLFNDIEAFQVAKLV